MRVDGGGHVGADTNRTLLSSDRVYSKCTSGAPVEVELVAVVAQAEDVVMVIAAICTIHVYFLLIYHTKPSQAAPLRLQGACGGRL